MINFKVAQLMIILVCVSLVKSQRDLIGDRCTVRRTGGTGSCALINNCPSVLNDIRNQRFPTVCGYDNLVQIVCCPGSGGGGTNTPSPTSPTRATGPTGRPNNPTGSISSRKCNEYKEFVYETQYVRNPFGNQPVPKRVSTCGFESKPFIVGGTAASAREFPHMALIGYQRDGDSVKWNCGGSLISEQFVMTAGHCMESRDLGPAKMVKLGDLVLSRTDDDADPIEVIITERIKHPNYRISSNYNDIGLLKLQRRLTFNRYIRPACLPDDTTSTAARKAVATGWGLVEWSGSRSDPLLKVTLDLFTYAECNDTFQYDINRRLRDGIVDATQFCAGSRTDNKDTCQGDSGGPLQVYHTYHCMYTVIGVTSFGKACGLVDNPGVYTRVSAYLPWIESVVWSQ